MTHNKKSLQEHRVWHEALWATMKKYNISTNLIQVIKTRYDMGFCSRGQNKHKFTPVGYNINSVA